ncbi:MAG: methylated-DNA--[protein]-cysteine S-methyltransferase [Hyphomicrobiales bacterium]
MTTAIHITRYPSPLGDLLLASLGDKLVHLDFEDNDARMRTIQGRRFGDIDWRYGDGPSQAVIGWLDAYFSGLVTTSPMTEVELNGTDFQKSVWLGLVDIPCGKTISYRQLAIELGMPKAVRAVAHSTALNPISILLPCHRVIASNGALTGYAGGLSRKRLLLDHEARMAAATADHG